MNKIVTSVVIIGLLGAVGYLLYKRKKDKEIVIEPKKEPIPEKKPERELKVIPKAELKKPQSSGIKKVSVDELVLVKDKKALETQLLPKRPVFTGGGGGAVVIETNIDKNVAPQRGVMRKEITMIRPSVPMNRPQEKLSELI